MGLFSALKKKKELPELEAPPPVEEPSAEEHSVQPSIPSYSMEPFPEQPEMPLETFQDVPAPPDDMRTQPPQPANPQPSVQQPMMPSAMQPPIPQLQEQQFPDSQHVDFPEIHPQQEDYNVQKRVEPPQMPKEALSLFQQSPQFKFYSTPSEDHPDNINNVEHRDISIGQEIPFDVKQELLTLPKEAKVPVSVKSHVPRRFMTVSMLMDVGEQLINMNDDVTLGKDTAFRLGDLNEQEIEKMAKWHALHQSMELRLAQIDKILFKA